MTSKTAISKSRTLYEWFNHERSTLAKELHDGISQDLIGINFKLARILRHLEKGTASIPDVTGQLRELSQSFNELFTEVRRFTERLHPQLLDSFGLTAALESELSEFAERTGVETALDAAPGFHKPGTRHSVDLFRISQDILGALSSEMKPEQVRVMLGGEQTDAGQNQLLQIAFAGGSPENLEREINGHRPYLSSRDRITELGGEVQFERSERVLSISIELPWVT